MIPEEDDRAVSVRAPRELYGVLAGAIVHHTPRADSHDVYIKDQKKKTSAIRKKRKRKNIKIVRVSSFLVLFSR